ncbi:tyrosine-protein phosphatase [Parafilimonas terrae]|uniref:protein-tyrosine-phosphatase n=1 Tax=Parafilimonas terrae TaxID=1465490 RepID=A0A1I5X0P7_9BACT|nr:CpsB/CapC family capsule biosynthesis tyrosine phosphatase [Parafilimonas terrae]SFQ25602.1 Tyrosine-protein phosphatase YwqE [Parafilimonas terrae]
MFSLFGTKKATPDLSFIGADMHSHLLPGLDDGLQTIDQTVSYIRQLQQMGYQKLICTPHILAEVYPNSPATILPKLELVRTALLENNIGIQVEAAAEYMVDLDFENHVMEGKPLLTFGKSLILIEMSYVAASNNIESAIFQLKLKGLQPVLAHPERYNYYAGNIETFQRFIDLGCYLQINILSLMGYYGEGPKKTAQNLLKKNMVTLVGTDMHHENHLNGLKDLASRKSFYKLFEGINIRNKELLL